jgi:hypothetical protein
MRLRSWEMDLTSVRVSEAFAWLFTCSIVAACGNCYSHSPIKTGYRRRTYRIILGRQMPVKAERNIFNQTTVLTPGCPARSALEIPTTPRHPRQRINACAKRNTASDTEETIGIRIQR